MLSLFLIHHCCLSFMCVRVTCVSACVHDMAVELCVSTVYDALMTLLSERYGKVDGAHDTKRQDINK